jgi:hypothetical protein
MRSPGRSTNRFVAPGADVHARHGIEAQDAKKASSAAGDGGVTTATRK